MMILCVHHIYVHIKQPISPLRVNTLKMISSKRYSSQNQISCEGDYCTPKGVFSLGFAFGTQPINGLNVEYRQLNSNCYWVDDPLSPLYNQWAESRNITWNSAEHLIDYPDAYKYSVVIDYNTNPIVPYKGSAIFIHCMTGSYTAGCVAVPENDMFIILKWLDKSVYYLY